MPRRTPTSVRATLAQDIEASLWSLYLVLAEMALDHAQRIRSGEVEAPAAERKG